MKYLATRKEEHIVGGSPEKPFISDTGVSKDSFWVYLAFAIEFMGFVLTIIGGAKRSSSFLITALAAIILIIIFDIVAGIQLHRNVARNTWLEAKIPDVSYDLQQQYRSNMGKGRIKNYFFMVFLIIIALFKSAALFLMHPFPGVTLYIPMAMLFLLAAYIHIAHTGYFLAYKKTQKGIDKDYKDFIATAPSSSNSELEYISQPFNTHTELRDLPLKAGFHRIEKSNEKCNEPGDFTYVFKINKLLTDNEILMLGASQSRENQTIIFRKGREYQFNIVNVPDGAIN